MKQRSKISTVIFFPDSFLKFKTKNTFFRRRSLERLSRIPSILRKNRPKKSKPEPIIFQHSRIVKNEPDFEPEIQKSTKKPPYSYMAMIEVHFFIFFMKKTVARWRCRQKQITECPCKKFTAGLKIVFLISKQRNRAGRILFATIFRFTIFSFATQQILQKCVLLVHAQEDQAAAKYWGSWR